jgi:hypothetical protein
MPNENQAARANPDKESVTIFDAAGKPVTTSRAIDLSIIAHHNHTRRVPSARVAAD